MLTSELEELKHAVARRRTAVFLAGLTMVLSSFLSVAGLVIALGLGLLAYYLFAVSGSMIALGFVISRLPLNLKSCSVRNTERTRGKVVMLVYKNTQLVGKLQGVRNNQVVLSSQNEGQEILLPASGVSMIYYIQ